MVIPPIFLTIFIPFRPYPTFKKFNGKSAKLGRNPQNDELQYAWGKEPLGNTEHGEEAVLIGGGFFPLQTKLTDEGE